MSWQDAIFLVAVFLGMTLLIGLYCGLYFYFPRFRNWLDRRWVNR
jgi:hypothetical protein